LLHFARTVDVGAWIVLCSSSCHWRKPQHVFQLLGRRQLSEWHGHVPVEHRWSFYLWGLLSGVFFFCGCCYGFQGASWMGLHDLHFPEHYWGFCMWDVWDWHAENARTKTNVLLLVDEFPILRVGVSADLAKLFCVFPFVLWRYNRGTVAVAHVLWPDFAVVVQARWILDSSDLSVNKFVQFSRQIFQETFSLNCYKSPIGSLFPPQSVSILSFDLRFAGNTLDDDDVGLLSE
jgi:hypothetical protein